MPPSHDFGSGRMGLLSTIVAGTLFAILTPAPGAELLTGHVLESLRGAEVEADRPNPAIARQRRDRAASGRGVEEPPLAAREKIVPVWCHGFLHPPAGHRLINGLLAPLIC